MTNWFSSIVLSSCVTLTIFLWIYSSKYVRNKIKRFVQIQFRQRIADSAVRGSDRDTFAQYYRTSLCQFQETNNNLLRHILEQNHRCQFYLDRSIDKNVSIDEFRENVRFTTYEDYRPYVDRMVNNGEENLLCSEKNIFYATSSGTTANIKLLPVTLNDARNIRLVYRLSMSTIWRSLPSNSFPSASQRICQLNIAKRLDRFQKTRTGIPIGPMSQMNCILPMNVILRMILASTTVVSNELVEDILDFETTCFVQLVFALAQKDLYAYSTTFSPTLLHSIEMIKIYIREMSECIDRGDFNRSSLVQKTIEDKQVQQRLNDRLREVLDEYGGIQYQNQRAEQIRRECQNENYSALFQRFWPNMIFVSVAFGGSFASYKDEIQYYCGENIRLINMLYYVASEGFFGTLASVETDEYLLLPTLAFFEFIREEDIDQIQPKTYLLSEIEPGHSYELVCTTRTGLIRYRMGDIIRCTRFLDRTENVVPIPREPSIVPRIPLISISYRIGTLLNVFGEKTSEQHIFTAIQQTIKHLKTLDLIDFTSYAKLNVFPVQYVVFIELNDENVFDEEFSQRMENELCRSNENYQHTRQGKKLDHLVCVLVRRGTFSNFLHQILLNERSSPIQIKPHRLLRKDEHIRYFYSQEISKSSSSVDESSRSARIE